MGIRHRNTELQLPKDFRVLYGKVDNVAQLKKEETEGHALFIFTPEIPRSVENLRPMHQSLISTEILFNKWHPECFRSQDAIGDAFVKLLGNCKDKRGIIFVCSQGEIRSYEMASTAAMAADIPLFEVTFGGKLVASERCKTDVLFRVKGAVYSSMASADYV